MNSYLAIAQAILREERRPLTARSILRLAYQRDLISSHLFGQTQHKTLQARLSEDILHRRERSSFFRTEPGKFFLREFMGDPTLPPSFRKEIRAHRRTRDLLRGPALAFSKAVLRQLVDRGAVCEDVDILASIPRKFDSHYVEPKVVPDDLCILWSVAAVRKDRSVLTYRTGRYRDNRDSFAQKRSLCFATLVKEDDRSLFDQDSMGITVAALTAVSTDLNVPVDHQFDAENLSSSFSHELKCIIWDELRSAEVLALVEVTAPDWFEPAQSRLSINDLRWMPLDVPPNDLDDFDPWSQSLLLKWFCRRGNDGLRPLDFHTTT
jgi:hypothetical protein